MAIGSLAGTETDTGRLPANGTLAPGRMPDWPPFFSLRNSLPLSPAPISA